MSRILKLFNVTPTDITIRDYPFQKHNQIVIEITGTGNLPAPVICLSSRAPKA